VLGTVTCGHVDGGRHTQRGYGHPFLVMCDETVGVEMY
jgi:hypothetical protein